jgi:ADP-sugar diphosphatase
MDPSEPERLRQSPKYRAWKRTVEAAGCTVGKVGLLLDLPRKSDGSILFAFIDAEVRDPEGRSLPRYALLRGHAAVVVTVVADQGTGERKFLMIRQRRVGHGGDSLEFPAGMLDDRVDDAAGTAARELEEETGLVVRPSALVALNDGPLYSSPGLDDEAIHYFAAEVALPSDRFRALDGGTGGNPEEGEHIRLGLWSYEDAVPHVDSIQVRLAFHLYFDRLRNGRREP